MNQRSINNRNLKCSQFVQKVSDISERVHKKQMVHYYSPLFMVLRLHDGELNEGFQKGEEWADQWKMLFNPDLDKHIQEVIFSRKFFQVTFSSHSLIFSSVSTACLFFM